MSYRIRLFAKDCVACNACYEACIDQNDIDVLKGDEPFRTGLEYEPRSMVKAATSACLHCSQAACIEVCPHGCLYRDEVTGFVVYDDTVCIGCGECAKVCPVDAIHFRADGRIGKCDGCNERVKNAMLPACVQCCPTGCLRLEEV